jgi:hypothetical protein
VSDAAPAAVAPRAALALRAMAPGRLDPAAILALQRTAGNRSVGRMLQRTAYTPGVRHDHTPSGRWADVQAAPNSGFLESRVCANSSPSTVVSAAVLAEFRGKPIAKAHLDWYLSVGRGADLVEDTNIERMLRSDTGVQAMITSRLPTPRPTSGTFAGSFKIEQTDYSDQDLRFAFGAVDRLDFEVDWSAGTLHAWFQDRYEWHPYYPGLYTAFPDDGARETNCVHAALVELQSGTAADFWMKGEATVPLSVLPTAAPASGGSGWW